MRLDETNRRPEDSSLGHSNTKRWGEEEEPIEDTESGEVEGILRAMSLKPSEELLPRGKANQLSDAADTQCDVDSCNNAIRIRLFKLVYQSSDFNFETLVTCDIL